MLRTRLKDTANRTKSDEDVRKYKKQRNFVSKLNERAKRQFYRDLDPVKTGKDKLFWKTFKPIFAGKSTNVSDKIVLIENGSIISNDKDIANIFNSYFVNITDTLPFEKPMLPSDGRMSDPVLHAIETYKNHPSIIKIKSTILVQERFQFCAVCPGDVWNEINQLASRKKSSGCIPTDILKLISGPYSKDIANYINTMFQSGIFPDILKLADVSPIFKCDDAFVKTNF